jgi:hypothetical protein
LPEMIGIPVSAHQFLFTYKANNSSEQA